MPEHVSASRKGSKSARSPSDATTLALAVTELRRELHGSALLEYCVRRLRADFLSEGAPPHCLVEIQGFGPGPVDDDALIAVESQLIAAHAATQGRVDRLLGRVVVLDRAGGSPAAGAMVAKIVANREVLARKSQGAP